MKWAWIWCVWPENQHALMCMNLHSARTRYKQENLLNCCFNNMLRSQPSVCVCNCIYYTHTWVWVCWAKLNSCPFVELLLRSQLSSVLSSSWSILIPHPCHHHPHSSSLSSLSSFLIFVIIILIPHHPLHPSHHFPHIIRIIIIVVGFDNEILKPAFYYKL